MRKFGLALLGVGAFLVVLGPVLRFYVYDQVAVAPQGQNSVSTLVGPSATIFDRGSLREKQTNLTTKVRTVGDVKAAEEHGHNTVVWVNTSSTKSEDGVAVSRSIERIAFDATSGEAVNCCGEYISTEQGVKRPVRHDGLLVKFPFDTHKKTYQFWDGSLEKAVPISYVREEKVRGLPTYVFRQSIKPTKVGEIDAPRSVLGLSGEGNVTADSMYSNVRTLWVEPITGVVIKRSEAQDNSVDYNGEPRLTTTKVTTGFDDKTVKSNVEEYGSKARLLRLVHDVLPWVLPLVGLISLVIGFLLSRPRERAAHAAEPEFQPV